jgi:predicted DNA-binding transcriptional regulator YafY
MTAAELAEELEVSVRTIYRDVEALAEAGVPIYAERGPHGGVRLVDGYRTRLTGLTAEEAEAVFLSGLPGPAAELGLGTVVAAARLKVMAALPPEFRARAGRIAERFHLDAPGWFQPAEQLPHLETLAGAVWQSNQVRILYRRGDRGGIVDRRVEPLGLVLKGGRWYLVAQAAANIRTYRVSRILEVEVLAERFERPEAFDLAAHWERSTAAYEQGTDQVELTVRMAPERVEDFAGIAGSRIMNAATRVPDPDIPGHVRLTVTFDWIDEAVGAALRLGADVEVLEPEWLRRSIFESATAIVARYAEGSVAVRPA